MFDSMCWVFLLRFKWHFRELKTQVSSRLELPMGEAHVTVTCNKH